MQVWLSHPQATKTVKVISLEDALMIALRNNPEILTSQLTRVMDKYALIEAKRTAFYPVLESVASGVTYKKGEKPSYDNVTADMSLNTLTARGPALGVDETDDVKGKSTTTMSLTQPLLQGFGNKSSDYLDYLNALDAEKIAIYSYKTSVVTVIESVVQNYRSLVETELELEASQRSLKTAKDQEQEDELNYKYGKSTKLDLVQSRAELVSQKLSYNDTVNSLATQYRDFIVNDLGLTSDIKLKIDKKMSLNAPVIPSQEEAIKMALKNNYEFQTTLINFNETKRNLILAKDAMKPQLDLMVSNSFTNLSDNNDPAAGFTLTFPLDDLTAQSSLVNEKIAYKEAEVALKQSRTVLISSVQDAYQTIKNDRLQIPIAEDQVKLNKETLDGYMLQKKYGRTTSFEVTSAQSTYLDGEISMIESKIALLNAVSDLQDILGMTLDQWHIKLKG